MAIDESTVGSGPEDAVNTVSVAPSAQEWEVGTQVLRELLQQNGGIVPAERCVRRSSLQRA